ncbi:MAG: hypothetical protein LC641_03085 [Spirochaeta sp.]|nr:hypothetical protein [Spirochaeta sp.]
MPDRNNSTRADATPETVVAPHYVALGEREREELLSQLGIVAPRERDCFHQLCRMWEPEISYNRFLAAMNHELGIEVEFARLMRRLQQQEYGLLCTAINNSKIANSAVVLTEPGSVRFFSYLIDEHYRELDLSLDAPLPTMKRLKADNIFVPSDFFRDLDDTTMSEFVHEPQKFARFVVFRYRFGSGDALPIPRARAEAFDHLLMRKVARRLESSDFSVAVSRVVGISLNELHRRSTGTGAIFWLGFSGTILTNIEKLKDLTGLSTGDDFFHCCELIERYLKASTVKEDEDREARKRRATDWKALAQSLRDKGEALNSETDFEAMVVGYQNDYPDDFDEFKTGLEQNYCTPPEGKQVARINRIGGFYVHRDRAYEAFREHIPAVKESLLADYQQLMRAQLQGKRGDYSAFLSKEALEADIAARLPLINPYCAAVLRNPEFLAEAIAHFVKSNGKKLDIERVRAMMNAYFLPGTMRLQELAIIFEVVLYEIYDTVTPQLPRLLRAWFRLSGKGTDLRSIYIARSAIAHGGKSSGIRLSSGKKRSDAVEKKATAKKPGGLLQLLGLSPSSKSNSQSSSRVIPAGATGLDNGKVAASQSRSRTRTPLRAAPPAPRPERRYTRQELDSAWDQFRRSLKD